MKLSRQTLLMFFAACYVLMFFYGLSSTSYNNDEYFYLLMGREILNGKTPYVDFFSAHMPLMLYPVAASFRLFGGSVAAGKLIPLISSIFVLVFTYLSGEKIKEGVGTYAALLLFLSPMFQLYSHALYGVALASAFITGAIYFHLSQRKTLSGVFCILSLFTRLNTIPFVLGLLVLNLRDRRFHNGLLYASPLFLLLLVPNFIEDTVLYHLIRLPHGLVYKIKAIYSLLAGQWLPIILAGACFVRCRRERTVRELGIVLGLFFLMTVFSKSLFDFYFYVGLPVVSVVAGYLVSLMSSYRRHMSVLAVLWITLNAATISASYTSNNSLEPLVSYVSAEVEGGNLFCMSLWCPYILFKSGSAVSGDLLDMADPRIEVFPERVAEKLFNAVSEDNRMALVDLKEINMYQKKFNVNTSKTVDYMLQHYFPVLYSNSIYNFGEEQNWWGSLNHVVFFKPSAEIESGAQIIEGNRKSTHYFLEEYMLLDVDLNEVRTSYVRNVSGLDDATPFIPKQLMGDNAFNMTLLSPKAIRWPLTLGTHYVVEEDGLRYYVYVSQHVSDTVNLFVITRSGDDILAFSQLTYDVVGEDFIEVRVYSKLSERILTGYAPTYFQRKISPAEYERLNTV
ncbi:MAG: hypothetical protein KKD39_06935 [Candidatus Altiarchaeota archaeon]|nr:hypothetical protein [Candidatus Altiarchaeota archaeon]